MRKAMKKMVKDGIKPLIRQVWKVSKSGQLMITIPLDVGIEEGDYVTVQKMRIQ